MPVVNNTLLAPNGDPIVEAAVTVVLIAAAGVLPGPGYTSDGEILGEWSTVTDEAGTWSVTLVGNDDIVPAGTYYRVTEDSPSGRAVVYISVPSTGGPYDLASLLVVPAASPPEATALVGNYRTAASWAADDPTLAAGEFGYESDTDIAKVGDGVTAWSELTPLTSLDVAYAAITSSQTFTTLANVVGLEITVPTFYKRPVWLHFYGLGYNNTAGDEAHALLTDAANTLLAGDRTTSVDANDPSSLHIWRPLAIGAGGTFKMRAQRPTGSGTATIYATNDQPAFLRAWLA